VVVFGELSAIRLALAVQHHVYRAFQSRSRPDPLLEVEDWCRRQIAAVHNLARGNARSPSIFERQVGTIACVGSTYNYTSAGVVCVPVKIDCAHPNAIAELLRGHH